MGRVEALLPDQLHEVGDGLQEPEGPRAVRPVAELHAPEQLALEPGRVRESEQDEVDDQERLDGVDPPGLVQLLGHQAVSTCTRSPRPSAYSDAIRTMPVRSLRFTCARSSRVVPFEATARRRPVAIPRVRASSWASSTSASGRWNASWGDALDGCAAEERAGSGRARGPARPTFRRRVGRAVAVQAASGAGGSSARSAALGAAQGAIRGRAARPAGRGPRARRATAATTARRRRCGRPSRLTYVPSRSR